MSSTSKSRGTKRVSTQMTMTTDEKFAVTLAGQHGLEITRNTVVESSLTAEQANAIISISRAKVSVEWIVVYGELREWWIGLLMVVQSDIIAAGGVGKLFNLLQERFALFNFSIDIEGKNWFQFHQTLKTPAARNTLLLILATDIAETTRHSIALRKMEEYYQKFTTLKFPPKN